MNLKEMGIIVIVIWAIVAVIGGNCWAYALNEWFAYFNKDTQVTFLWKGFIMGAIPYFGALGIPFAFITFILMMFLV